MNLVDLVREDFGISGNGRWLRSDIHSSLVVDSEKERFYFNSRGIRGTIFDYLVYVRGISANAAKELVKTNSAGMPTYEEGGLQIKFEKLVNLFHASGKNDREYWYKRKLTDGTIDRYRLGNYDGWNLIPIYNNGYFVNFQCRKDTPEKRINFWYKDADFKPVLYNREVLTFVSGIYIVEGMVDCILLNQLGLPAVCSTNGANSWNSGWIKYFSKIKSIVYVADNDSAGKIGAYSVANALGLYRVKILRFKEQALKYGSLDYFRDGGTKEEFLNLVQERGVYGFEKESI